MLQEYTVKGLHGWLLPHLLDLPGVSTKSRVLDLGCGTGAWLARLNAAGFQSLAGIDRHNDFSASGIQFIEGDLDGMDHSELPTFDVITAIEIIEHVANPEALISLAACHLNSGGWLAITTPNIYSVRYRARFLLMSQLGGFEGPRTNPEHIHPLVLEAFTRVILPRYPFTLEHVTSYPPYGSDGARWFARLAGRLLSFVFSNELPGDTLCLLLRKL
jgi:SAM-dependent methyltransferase